ncbi:Hypothetical protein, putative [Bodo saltans]|uniref:Uncharacterized protein n=1 Tax=Bodo saltans TaxID=75058 RepID=A0A0S4JR68_BODSA|nr:Hypothetical protein, putative [Bodo saltans]|eukprot:CUG91567.1 Hypothetical protein, putative [Bodo saltans]
MYVELPQESSARFHIPRIVGLVKSEGPRLLLKGLVKPSTLTTKAGAAGSSVIAFPALSCDHGKDSTKASTSLLLETFEAILDPHVTNHMLMAYEKVVTELVGIVAKSTARHTFQSTNDVSDEDEDPYHEDHQRAPLQLASTAPRSSGRRLDNHAVIRTFLLLSVRNIRVSLVTSMSEARVMFQQLDLSREVHHALRRSVVLGRCTGLRVALVDRDDYDQHMQDQQAHSFHPNTPLAHSVLGGSGAAAAAGGPQRRMPGVVGAPTPSVNFSASSNSTLNQRFGGYIWGMVELSVHFKAESKAAKKAPSTKGGQGSADAAAAGLHTSTDWSGDIEASALASGLGSAGRKYSIPQTVNATDGPASVGLNTATLIRSDIALSSRWGVEFIAHSPLVILRPGLPQHVTAALQEANHATAEMRAQAALDSRRLQTKLQASKAYKKIVALKQRWKMERKDSSETVVLPTATVTPPQAAVVEGKKKRNNRHATPLASTVASPIEQPASHQVATVKRLIVSVQVRNFLVVVPCGEAAFRSVLEGRPDMFEQSRVEKGDKLVRQRFVPVMALKFHIRSTVVSWMREELDTTTSVPLYQGREQQYSHFATPMYPNSATLGSRHGRPPSEASSGLFTPRLGSNSVISSNALPQAHQLTMQSEVSTKGTIKIEDLNLFFTDGSRLAPSHLQSKNFSFKTLVLGGVGTLTESDPTVLQKERYSSFDRARVAKITLPFSTQKELPPSIVLVAAESPPRRGRQIDPLQVLSGPAVANHGGSPALNNDGPVDVGASEHININLNISGPELHCTSRCTAMVSELMADFTPDAIPTTGATSSSDAPLHQHPSLFSVPPSAGPSALADTDSPTGMLLKATATPKIPVRRTVDARGILEPGKITLYTLQQQQRGGAMNKSFSRPTLGNRRGVSFTLSSSPPPPSATAGAAFDGHVNNQHRPSATEAMSVPLPSAVMTVLAERGGPSDLADSATIRIAVTAKRMEVDPAIAILWQEVQLWVKIHQQDSRDRAEKIYKHVLEFATNRVAKGREQQGTMDVETATVHSASSASKKRQGTGNNSNGKGGVKNSAALNAIMDAGLPVPRAFATALWFLREQPNVAQSASGRSVVPPTSPVRGKNDSVGSVGNQSFFVDAAHTTPTTPGGGGTSGVAHTTNTKANKTTIHVNLTGLRLDLSTINTSESTMRQTNSRVLSGGPHDAPVNMGGASGATNTFAALFTDHDGSLDLVIQHLSIPAASHHQPSLIMPAPNRSLPLATPPKPAPNRSLPLATPPTVLVTIVARRLRFECQNKVEVKSLEMFLPHMIVSASMRTTPTDQLVASEIPTRTSAPPPPPPPPPPTQGSQRMLDESATGKQFQSKRGARSSLPPLTLPQQPPPPPHVVRTTPASAAAPAVQETDVISVTVHVPSAADDAQGHQNVGGVLGGFHPGPQMTLRAQHLNQIILVATHWQQKWNEAREETVRLFKSSAVRRLKKLTRSASSPPRRPARQQDGGHHSPLPKKPSPILFRRRAASSTMPPNQSVVNESMAPDAPSNHLNTLLRYPIAVRQWAVSVGRSTSWVDLGGGNKHEFSIGTLRSTGRHVVYHTMESLLDGSVLMQDSRIRSDGVLSGMNSIAKMSLRGFLILPADAADLEMNNAVKQFELSSKLTSTTTSSHDSTINSTTTSGRAASPRTDAALCPQSFDQMLRSTDGRTKRLIVSVEDVNVHFKERQIRDVALFSIDVFRLDAKDAFDKAAVEESDQIPATAGATTTPTPQQASSQMSGLTPRPSGAVHVDPATAVPSSITHSSPSHAAALISVDLERCLMGITPQTSAAFLGLGGEVSSLVSDQKAIAAANILLLSGGRGRTSSAVDDEFGLTSANNSSIRLLGSDGGSSTVNSVTFLPPPRAPTSSTPPLLSDALTPLTRRITSGQMSVTLKYSTIMIGSVIDARHLRGDGIAAGVDNVQDCIVLRVPDMEVAFAQVVLPPQAHVSDNEEPPTAERTSSWTTAAGFRHAIIGAWALARKWRPKQTTGDVSNSAATPSAASQKTDNTPTRELFGDNTSPASPQCLVGSDTDHGKHALQLAEKATVRKLLMLSIEQVELTRLHANERVVILGFRGKNVVELFAEQHLHLPTMSSLTASSLPSQIVTRSSGSGNGTVHVNVPYSILLRQTHPWTGSPRFEDFQAMLDVIRTFTHPPNVEALQDFAALRKTMEFTGDTRGGGTSGATHAGHLTGTAAPPHNTTSSTLHQQQKTVVAVDYVFQALDARRMKFAPQLRFGRDVSVSLETILSWLGTQEEMIPRRLFLSVCRPMETLMAAVEGCTSTEKMIAKFGIDAIEHGLASSE